MGKKRDLSDFERGMVVGARRPVLSIHPFMTTVYPSSDGYFQQDNVTKLKSSQTVFLNMTMSSLYSNGLHSHQISIQ